MPRWLVTLLLFALTAPSGAAADPSATPRTVRYGLVPVEPLVWRRDGRPAGFCVDILEEVAARESWRLEYVDGSWDENLARLEAGEIDLLAPTAWSAARDSVLDYSRRPLLTLWSQVYVRRGSPVNTILDLAGRTVAVMKGDINGEHFKAYVARFGIACRIVEEPNLAGVFDRVAGGGADAGVAPNVYGYTHARTSGLVATPVIFEPYDVYYAVAAGTNGDLLAALDAALGTWQEAENSFYHDRLDYWFGGRSYGLRTLPRWILAAGAAVLVLALAMLAWNRLLGLEVRRRTWELRRSQDRFRAIFDNNMQLTGLLTPRGIVLEANPAALNLVGAQAGDVVGRPFWEGPWWCHDAGLRERVREAVRTAAGGGTVRFEATHPAPDGSLRLVDFTLTPVYDEDGQIIHLLPEAQDVTDQRHGEIRYRTLFETAGDAIFLMAEGVFVECNARTLELFRCDRDQIVGRRPAEFSPERQPDGRLSTDAAVEHIARAVRERLHTFEWRHRRHDGQDFDAEVTLTSYVAAGHTYLQAIVRDVTERKQLEADLRHAQKMEAIGTLAGGIAHDFNNILAAILGFGELARLQAEDDPSLCGNIDQIMVAGERARELVQQILAFSRRTVENRRAVDLRDIVTETLRLLRSSIPTTIALRHDLQDAGPVVADPTSLRQVVMNLCTNAYQALADRGGELAVTLREVQAATAGPAPGPGDWVVLEVRDDGPGMSAGVKAKIFEPYFTTKGPEQGTGLGLAVVHGIVQEQGGAIEVESAPGEGALFRVWLPRRGAAVTVAAAAESSAVEDVAGQERVLLVDDEPDIVRICEMGLARSGYRVSGFTTPGEALAAFRADPDAWDAVVSDVTMPGMTGVALAAAVLETRPDVPVILCTGYSEGLTPEAARAAGIRNVLVKPVPVARLAAEIRAAVDAGARR